MVDKFSVKHLVTANQCVGFSISFSCVGGGDVVYGPGNCSAHLMVTFMYLDW